MMNREEVGVTVRYTLWSVRYNSSSWCSDSTFITSITISVVFGSEIIFRMLSSKLFLRSCKRNEQIAHVHIHGQNQMAPSAAGLCEATPFSSLNNINLISS